MLLYQVWNIKWLFIHPTFPWLILPSRLFPFPSFLNVLQPILQKHFYDSIKPTSNIRSFIRSSIKSFLPPFCLPVYRSSLYGVCIETSGEGTGGAGRMEPGTDLIIGSSNTSFLIASLQPCRAGAERRCSSHFKTWRWVLKHHAAVISKPQDRCWATVQQSFQNLRVGAETPCSSHLKTPGQVLSEGAAVISKPRAGAERRCSSHLKIPNGAAVISKPGEGAGKPCSSQCKF